MTRRFKPTAREIAAAQRKFPVGARVRYWAGARDGFEPTGEATVEGEPYLFGGHTLSAYVRKADSGHDTIAVTHLELVAP